MDRHDWADLLWYLTIGLGILAGLLLMVGGAWGIVTNV